MPWKSPKDVHRKSCLKKVMNAYDLLEPSVTTASQVLKAPLKTAAPCECVRERVRA